MTSVIRLVELRVGYNFGRLQDLVGAYKRPKIARRRDIRRLVRDNYFETRFKLEVNKSILLTP